MVAVNEAVHSDSPEEVLTGLQNEALDLLNVIPENIAYYIEELKKSKTKKEVCWTN